MPYVEAFSNEQEKSWITANVNALSYYGGVPRIIQPDNVKTAVKTPRYYEPMINTAFWELAQHYALAVIPARVRKPKDKPLVEETVGWLETWLLGRLRKQRFFSFRELNDAILIHIDELSKRPFQKREGSRRSEFQRVDRPSLRPLPLQKYEAADIVFRSVGDNYHVEYDGMQYSTPYTLHRERIMLRATDATIEIYDRRHIRMATHVRRHSPVHGRYVTNEAHMPPNHRAVHRSRQFDGERYRKWAKSVGENTLHVIERLLLSGAVEEQGYRSCMGILQFSKTYGGGALEDACAQARAQGSCTYSTVMSIVKGAMRGGKREAAATPTHENIRGGGYYK